jgi:hypothetical protein
MAESQLPEGYLDIYKLAVEMADRVSARRAISNSFLLTVQSAFVGLIGAGGLNHRALAGAGLVLAAAWWALLRSYRRLNGAKYTVLLEMEKQLSAKPFTDEWGLLKQDPVTKWRGRYAELGLVERIVPVVFAAINIIVLVRG